jgi:hypothetical protein
MTAFVVPPSDGKPLKIVDLKVDLLLSPPVIQEKNIEEVDNYVSTQSNAIEIIYSDAPTEEGYLNIYVCKFKTGKHRLHIFGKIKGQEFKIDKELSGSYYNTTGISSDRIKYVLVKSRNILRTYYLNANLKSIEEHLMAFLIPA